MHKISNRKLFSRDVRLELDNLGVKHSTDTGKSKTYYYRGDQQSNAFEKSANSKKDLFVCSC